MEKERYVDECPTSSLFMLRRREDKGGPIQLLFPVAKPHDLLERESRSGKKDIGLGHTILYSAHRTCPKLRKRPGLSPQLAKALCCPPQNVRLIKVVLFQEKDTIHNARKKCWNRKILIRELSAEGPYMYSSLALGAHDTVP